MTTPPRELDCAAPPYEYDAGRAKFPARDERYRASPVYPFTDMDRATRHLVDLSKQVDERITISDAALF